MKTLITLGSAALFAAGALSAQTSTVTVTDGDGNLYGDTQGFRIDFNSTPNANVLWLPPLVDGASYFLDSISVRYGGSQANTTPKFLGAYSGLEGGVLSGFLGASTNAITFGDAPVNEWTAFSFSDLTITADSAVGEGTGLVYFAFQTDQAALVGFETTVAIHRINADDGSMASHYSNILAFGAVQGNRSPEYQAELTLVPEPSTYAMILGLGTLLFVGLRRRHMQSHSNTE